MAVDATEVFMRNYDVLDEETQKLLKSSANPLMFKHLKYIRETEDSKALNVDEGPKVIIASSGMMTAGRIRHHLKHNLWRPESTVLFVGYQAAGTLGRILVDGVKSVKLFGETIDVKAQIRSLNAISGHADKDGLLKWASAISPAPKKFFICHGEEEISEIFANTIRNSITDGVVVPYNGEKWDIHSEKIIIEG